MKHALSWGLFLCLCGTACAVSTDSSSGAGVTVNLNVTFAGQYDCGGGLVDNVRATAPNGGLPAKTVPCTSGLPLSLQYTDVAPGTYQVFVEGLKPSGSGEVTAWSLRQDIIVTATGTHDYSFDLKQTGVELIADFSFGAPDAGGNTLSCDQVGVKSIHVVIDPDTSDALQATVNCHDQATGRDAAAVTGIAAGNHNYDFKALDDAGNVAWEALISNEAVAPDQSNEFNVNLQPKEPGTLQLQWSFAGADMGSCMSAGVQQLQYALTNPDGTPGMTGTVACADPQDPSSNGNATLMNLTAGVYSLSSMFGLDGSAMQTWAADLSGDKGKMLVLPGQTKSYLVTLTPMMP